MTTPVKEVLSEKDLQDIYNKIMKEGYKSKSAGDMWEPSYRPDDMALALNKILNEKLVKYYGKDFADNQIVIGREQLPVDRYIILGFEPEVIKRESLKVEFEGYVNNYNMLSHGEDLEKFNRKRVKITMEEL